jgi:hypothetical protein
MHLIFHKETLTTRLNFLQCRKVRQKKHLWVWIEDWKTE